MLSCNSVSLSIGERKLFDISITMLPGSITVVSGANGSGKSSFLRVLSGLQSPTSGNVLWYGQNIQYESKPMVNYIGHHFGIKDELTVVENLQLWSRLYESENMIQAAIHYFGLLEVMMDKAFTLSAGNRKKLALARLLACNSDLWLLDEVETNLDEKNLSLLHNVICTKANNGGVIVMTSHNKTPFKHSIHIAIEDFCE